MAEHLWDLFLRPFTSTPDKEALVLSEGNFTYGQLGQAALSISTQLKAVGVEGPFVGLYAHRDLTTYAGMLGIMHAGHGYMPLHPELPQERLAAMLERSGTRAILTSREHADGAIGLAERSGSKVHVIIANAEVKGERSIEPCTQSPYAYLLFTSGSTGVPKGVPIRQSNVLAYLKEMERIAAPTATDRFTQLFEFTFDLSVHDIFLCWAAGGTLVVPSREQLLAPAAFVRANAITCWFAVPSMALLMDRMRTLKPGAMPTLRFSAFCGEPLPEDLVRKWSAAAPNSRVLNLYGPTEATIAITAHEWKSDQERGHVGIVSIGKPFPSAQGVVLNEAGVGTEEGELWLGGPQVAEGYWQAPEQTGQVFQFLPSDPSARYYRTGDRVRKDEHGNLYFLSRTDQQVKVRGHRIELEEINHVLREQGGAAFAQTVAFPITDGIALGLVAFLPLDVKDQANDLLNACRAHLPEHMVPARLIFLPDLPTNSNGKVDRKALLELLNSEQRTGSNDSKS